MSLAGHYWTLRGYLDRRGVEAAPPPAEPWSTVLRDPDVGPVRLTGRLTAHQAGQGRDLLLIVHGLGGCAESGYVLQVAAAASAQGLASLSVNVRGADRRGEDYGHAALSADIAAAIASPELRQYSRVALLGFSLGGHMALTYARRAPDPRVAGVAAVCPPLDLEGCCDHIDRPAAFVYRRYLLARLCEIYAAVAARASVPLPIEEARRIRSQREFDDRVIAPRHGFEGVDDYYARASVGPRLTEVSVPTLLVLGEQDPMIPAASLLPFVDPAPEGITVRWVKGGHVGFGPDLDLGEPSRAGFEAQILSWVRRAMRGEC